MFDFEEEKAVFWWILIFWGARIRSCLQYDTLFIVFIEYRTKNHLFHHNCNHHHHHQRKNFRQRFEHDSTLFLGKIFQL